MSQHLLQSNELVSQNKAFVSTQLETLLTRLKMAMQSRLQQKQHQQALLAKHLLTQDPKHKLQQQTLIADDLNLRLQHAMGALLNTKSRQDSQLKASLLQHSPKQTINLALQNQLQLKTRLKKAMQTKLKESESALQNSINQLNTVSPLATLARGYAIVKDEKGKVTTDVATIQLDDEISVHLHQGEFKAKVTSIKH
ncbi:exodeoxyribonuclease VII large subunit [Psychromonas sp. KJ10-10]|uniref:exodeoxyribonuclease VII large subunit n=1 Tax=Psychromonas sp. KJ10-10 TaxID=3391823 RepID=UPI0039B3D713